MEAQFENTEAPVEYSVPMAHASIVKTDPASVQGIVLWLLSPTCNTSMKHQSARSLTICHKSIIDPVLVGFGDTSSSSQTTNLCLQR